MFWGSSPAVDLVQEYLERHELKSEELNILVLGGSDARHLLMTFSRLHRHRCRHPNLKLQVYLQEPCLEPVARQLLLLAVALEPQETLSIQKKTRFFMEIYGNTLLRPSASKYLTSKAEYLVKLITKDLQEDDLGNMTMLNLEMLKYKERDYLENLFKYWSKSTELDIVKLWDKCVRRYLGARYDSKMGAFDWDLHMHLHGVGAEQVCPQEYKQWRAEGTAFTWTHGEASRSNRSLVAGVASVGEGNYVHCGYMGDIVIGPFVNYGIVCENKEMLKKRNGVNAHRATDVTEENLRRIFYQMMFGKDYPESPEEILEGDTKMASNIRVNIFPCRDSLERYRDMFHLVWCSRGMLESFEKLKTTLTLNPNSSLLLFEGCKFDPSFRKPQYEQFEQRIRDLGELVTQELGSNSRVSCEVFDASKDCMAKFVVTSLS